MFYRKQSLSATDKRVFGHVLYVFVNYFKKLPGRSGEPPESMAVHGLELRFSPFWAVKVDNVSETISYPIYLFTS